MSYNEGEASIEVMSHEKFYTALAQCHNRAMNGFNLGKPITAVTSPASRDTLVLSSEEPVKWTYMSGAEDALCAAFMVRLMPDAATFHTSF